MKRIGNELVAEDGMVLHLNGTDSYLTRCNLLEGINETDFEEITQKEYDDINKYPSYDYDMYVESLIRQRYTLSQELAIQRQRDTKPDEFRQYFEYCEQCKLIAKSNKTYFKAL